MDIGGHPGIHTRTGHTETQLSVAVDEVEGSLRAHRKCLQVGKSFPPALAEDFQKIVARALGHIGNGGVLHTCRAVDHFIERSVAAAGINTNRFAFFHRAAGETLCVTCGPGHGKLIFKVQLFDLIQQLFRTVFGSRCGVDDEIMSHICLRFLC